MAGALHTRAWALVGALAVAPACGEVEPALQHVPLPALQGANTLVLGIRTARELELHALDPSAPYALELNASEVVPGTPFLAIGISRSLTDLGRAPGRLPPTAPLGLELFRAPSAVAIWEGESEGWKAGSTELLAEDTRSYRLPAEFCRPFRSELIYEGEGNARFMVPLDGGRVMVGLERSTLIVTSTSVTPLGRANLGGAVAPRSAVRSGPDIWITDAFGGVYRGSAGLPVAFRQVSEEPRGLVLGRGGSERDDLFLIEKLGTTTSTYGVHRRTAEGWRQIGDIEDFDGAPVPGGPGEAFLPAERFGFIYRLTPDRISAESVGDFAIESLANIPGYGVLGGTVDGRVLRREGGGRWTLLPGREFGWWVSDIAAYRGNFVALLASGTVVQYLNDTPCTDLSFRNILERGQMVAFEDGLLLSASFDFEAKILFLRP